MDSRLVSAMLAAASLGRPSCLQVPALCLVCPPMRTAAGLAAVTHNVATTAAAQAAGRTAALGSTHARRAQILLL